MILVSRDGTGRGVDGTASPVRDQDGHTIGAVLVFKDVTDLQEEQRRLTYSANHDVLTGLPNRSAFSHVLAEACRVASSSSRRHALLFIDLDRFKPVNDTAGHAAGDERRSGRSRSLDVTEVGGLCDLGVARERVLDLIEFRFDGFEPGELFAFEVGAGVEQRARFCDECIASLHEFFRGH